MAPQIMQKCQGLQHKMGHHIRQTESYQCQPKVFLFWFGFFFLITDLFYLASARWMSHVRIFQRHLDRSEKFEGDADEKKDQTKTENKQSKANGS